MNIYFECNMGAAGDMIASALFDLFDNKDAVLKELNSLSLPHTQIKYSKKSPCGISASHLSMVIDGKTETHATEHYPHSRNLGDIEKIVNNLNVSNKVKNDVKSIYQIIAEAEAKAHSTEVSLVHFHELGALDAIADITVSAYFLEKLNPEKILSSAINVGGGNVHCAHGVLPVPAPATANILEGVPYCKSEINTELCTPTGAAVLKYFADEFADAPTFNNVSKIGIGAGTKELERANIIRAFAFENEESGGITELSCNIDDMTGEDSAFAAERLLSEGALDAFITPIFMKKGRPAFMLTVLCKNEESKKFAKLIFKHTSTLGIRKYTPSRYTLKREISENSGVHIKRSEGYEQKKEKIEFEDAKALAIKEDISIFEARKRIKKD